MTSGRCPTHDLALNDEGLCIVCRREADARRGALRRLEPRSTAPAVGTLVGIVLVVGLLSAVVGFTLAEPTPEPRPLARLQDPKTSARDEAEAANGQFAVRQAPGEEAKQEGRSPNARGKTGLKRPPSPVAAAITLYSADWCPACKAAKRYLRAQNIDFTEVDVDKQPAAARRLRQINPKGTIPTFEIGGLVEVGFNPSRLERVRARAARR